MKVKKENIAISLGIIDLLLLSSGFENRSKELSNCLNRSKIKNSILFHLDDNYIIAGKNKSEIVSKLDIKNIVEYPKNDSYATYNILFEEITKKISNINKQKISVVVDVTAFSREILLILIKVLTNDLFQNKLQLKFVHTPVDNYCENEKLWLTKGVREIRPVFGYSGLMTPSKKLLLIVLNGFEDERTETIIDSFEPNALVLGNPSLKGSINAGLKSLADEKYEKIKSKFNSILKKEIEFSCVDIRTTINILKKINDEFKDEYNIVISPLNNKTSTIAVALSAILYENIQVSYASANQYNISKQLSSTNFFLVYDVTEFLVHIVKIKSGLKKRPVKSVVPKVQPKNLSRNSK
ncbi:hypothetical protein [Flavobacterium cerinum]|uniref:Uncharacterized protein n=1 Tax=Flavobacterium cerinum TaxID=2502784 RepID=A0A444HD77_9FLAO|nr:hypothetical protein [Flavobacterium cerinum]RWX02203.1 hypothetical protein EPI11_03015 [Flavobacterium cerinum]